MFTAALLRHALKEVGHNVKICRAVSIGRPENVTLSDGVYLGPRTQIGTEIPEATLVLYSRVHIVADAIVDYSGGLKIGENTFISEGCIIQTHTHGHDPRSIPTAIPLTIGANVWLGQRSAILPGVRYIGDNAIIGLGAIVTRAVEPGEIVAGNPARPVRSHIKAASGSE